MDNVINGMLVALKDSVQSNSTLNSVNTTVTNTLTLNSPEIPKPWFAQTGNIVVISLFFLAFIAVILIYISKKINPVSPFLYSNARIQARSTGLITDKKLAELSESKSLRDFENQLSDFEYSNYIEELDSADREDLTSLHIVLEKAFMDSVEELIKLSPKKTKPLFNAYMMFSESKIIKTIYRVKFLNKKLNEKLVFPVGNINEILLKHLLEAETVADMEVIFAPTNYNNLFSKKYESIEEFEIALDTFVLRNFIDTATKTKMFDAAYIVNIINKKIDVMNLVALLKFRIRGMVKEQQKKLLIDNKTTLTQRFKKLIEAKTLNDFVEVCKGLAYYMPLTKALELYGKTDSYMEFELELLRFYKKFVVDNDLYHTLGPYPLFSYLTKKQFELRNLFIVSKGIEAGLKHEKIKEMII